MMGSNRFFLFKIIFIIAISTSYYIYSFAQQQTQMTEEHSVDSRFSRWFQWKMQTNLTEKQKTVIEYLKKASTIFDKAFNTRCVQPTSKYGYPNPKEAIAITKQAIIEIKALPYPKECAAYRDANIKIMKNIIIPYHYLRLKFKEGTEEFNLQYENFQLSEIKGGLDVKQYNEYFESLKKVGFYDNIEKEMKMHEQ
jgi:hypothetical protein